MKTLVEGRVGVEVEARKEEASKSYEGVLVIGVEGGGVPSRPSKLLFS